MEIVAHALWGAAAAMAAKRRIPSFPVIATACWATFPDVLAFGLPGIIGLGMRLAGSAPAGAHGHFLPHINFGIPFYPLGHSFVTFAVVYAISSLAARRFLLGMLGWLSHILIDIGTHSETYYATRFLWPFSEVHVDGIPWWTPWFWVATYVALAAVYFALWKKGWLAGWLRARTAK